MGPAVGGVVPAAPVHADEGSARGVPGGVQAGGPPVPHRHLSSRGGADPGRHRRTAGGGDSESRHAAADLRPAQGPACRGGAACAQARRRGRGARRGRCWADRAGALRTIGVRRRIGMREIRSALSGVKGMVRFHEPMRLYTSFRSGGPADALIEPEDEEALRLLMVQARKAKVPVFVMGGTNLLVRDGGIRGVVVRLTKFDRIEEHGGGLLYAQGGVGMPRLLKYALQRKLAGLEFAAGIPGTLAGAVVMNAGTRLGEMKDVVQQVRMVTPFGEMRELSADEVGFEYRRTRLLEGIIVGAWLRLRWDPTARSEATVKEALHRRKATQPLALPNAGCVFKNPDGEPAGRLIETAGLKGAQVGDAQVSPLHANFIVNRGRATARDVLALHGPGGEDGTIQGMLEVLRMPYTGSGVQACALAMDKAMTKCLLEHGDLPVPRGFVRTLRDRRRPLPSGFKLPLVVKPVSQGSTLGITIIRKRRDLGAALQAAFAYGPAALIEEYIDGREFTVAILNDRPLPVVEIIPKSGFYDFGSKYTPGASHYHAPAKLSSRMTKQLQVLALEVHRRLGCRGATRVDFRLDKRGRPFILELNAVPGMTETSLLPMAAKAARLSYEDMVEAILASALQREAEWAPSRGRA